MNHKKKYIIQRFIWNQITETYIELEKIEVEGKAELISTIRQLKQKKYSKIKWTDEKGKVKEYRKFPI